MAPVAPSKDRFPPSLNGDRETHLGNGVEVSCISQRSIQG